MATTDSGLTFRPWGWAAANAFAILVFAPLVYRLAPTWVIVLMTPGLLFALIRELVGSAVSVVIEEDELRWRTLFSAHVAPMALVASVHPGPRWSDRHERFIDIEDGRQLRVTEGPEFTRLLAPLRQRIPDLDREDMRPEPQWP